MHTLVAETPAISRLWSHWSAKRRAAVPRVGDFDFDELARHFPQLELIERDAAGGFRCRPVGAGVVSGLAVTPRGRFLHEAMPAKRLEAANRHFATAWRAGRPLCARNKDAASSAVDRVTTRIVLPLADHAGRIVALLTTQAVECRIRSRGRHWLSWRLGTDLEQIGFLDAPAESLRRAA
jgi:hypothetical protein